MEVVVDDGGEQIVSGGDSVEVAREMEVDGFRRLHGATSAAGGTTFATEDGSHGRLTQGEGDALADLFEALGQADGDGGLAFAGRRGGDGGDEDEAAFLGAGAKGVQGDFGFVSTVGDEVVGREGE